MAARPVPMMPWQRQRPLPRRGAFVVSARAACRLARPPNLARPAAGEMCPQAAAITTVYGLLSGRRGAPERSPV